MKIELEQSDIDTITSEVITNVSAALVPKIQEMIMVLSAQDQLLTKKEVYEGILKCTAATAEELYFSRPDFPSFEPPQRPGGTKTQRRFSRRAVEAWIAKNCISNA
ncbi:MULTISPECIES: hypothetical protein [Bacillus amyloliquefaciens group]|uniref:hypothetical protein n=1 Tax=Bacillus amyloliquefaciens group TaxID=1938374 RepID=UPI0002416403|nr:MULTISPECIES: hypothetical protein [Bacillus amyloliquefaciens group]AGF26875.1 hypothetical protein KSO_006890 [Bacillus amyloliquefaciens IT-45]AMP31021.1 hypothetical protein AS588_03035 [Bacillus amyloliquefaciens]ERK83411.1 hypothetical protein N786_09065 [Bacillus amyloliquefaciens UASWS BA1]MBH5314330.1 hypothetical protein [Bacillus velezensis]MDQ1917346.1 hypothetical protein [Bacillus velezensis]